MNDMEIRTMKFLTREQKLPKNAPLPIPSEEIEDDEIDGVDPYQEMFNYLIAKGIQAAEAWDKVWENPSRSAEIGWKLALNRNSLAGDLALA